MKAITSLTALVLGASLAGAALAQTGTGGDTPPAQAGAGAAAAVSGNAPAQGQTPQDAPDATDAAGTDDATADTAQKPLPEGVDITPDHTETAAGTTPKVSRPSRSRMTARSISPPSTAIADIRRNVMSATGPTAKARPMPRR